MFITIASELIVERSCIMYSLCHCPYQCSSYLAAAVAWHNVLQIKIVVFMHILCYKSEKFNVRRCLAFDAFDKNVLQKGHKAQTWTTDIFILVHMHEYVDACVQTTEAYTLGESTFFLMTLHFKKPFPRVALPVSFLIHTMLSLC